MSKTPVRASATLIIVVLAAASFVAAAQTPAGQAPLPPQIPTASLGPGGVIGTGLIVGRVLDPDDHPVPGAMVTIASPSLRGGRRVLTGPQGAFVFRDLPAAVFTVTSTKSGWMDGALGRVRPTGIAKTVQLRADEALTDMTLRMWHRAAITGVVSDETGEPVVGASVAAIRRVDIGGHIRLLTSLTAATDDRGIYRLGDLAPDDYLVAIPATATTVPADVISRVGQTGAASAALVASLSVVGTATSNAVSVGGLMFRNGLPSPSPASANPRFAYPTTFYPGVVMAGSAAIIHVDAGTERSGIDIRMTPVPAVRITGRVSGRGGEPAAERAVTLARADEVSLDQAVAVGLTDASGAFTLLGVPAGQFMLRASPFNAPARGIAASASAAVRMAIDVAAPANANTPPSALFAQIRLDVGTADLTGVELDLAEGAYLSGHVEIDGTSAKPAPDIPIILEPIAPGVTSATQGRVDANGNFTTGRVGPGRYVVRPARTPPGWTLKSIVAAGRDVTDMPIDITSTPIDNVVVTFTDRIAALGGQVTGVRQGDGAAMVLAFPADPSMWRDFGSNPRRIRSAVVSQAGRFQMDAMPEGQYYLVAVREQDADGWIASDRLAALAGVATSVSIGDGEKKNVSLAIAAVP